MPDLNSNGTICNGMATQMSSTTSITSGSTARVNGAPTLTASTTDVNGPGTPFGSEAEFTTKEAKNAGTN